VSTPAQHLCAGPQHAWPPRALDHSACLLTRAPPPASSAAAARAARAARLVAGARPSLGTAPPRPAPRPRQRGGLSGRAARAPRQASGSVATASPRNLTVYIRRLAAARRMPGRAFFEAAARRMGEFTEEVRCRYLLPTLTLPV